MGSPNELAQLPRGLGQVRFGPDVEWLPPEILPGLEVDEATLQIRLCWDQGDQQSWDLKLHHVCDDICAIRLKRLIHLRHASDCFIIS